MSAPVENTPPSPRSSTTFTVVVHGELVEVRAELLPHRRVVGVASLRVVERDAGDAGRRHRAPAAPARQSPDRLLALRLHGRRPYSVTSRYFQPRASAPRGRRKRMQFGFDEDQLAMRDAVRAFCADRFDLDRRRRPRGAGPPIRRPGGRWPTSACLGMLADRGDRASSRPRSSSRSSGRTSRPGRCCGRPWRPRSSTAWPAARWSPASRSSEGAPGPYVVEHAEECDALLVVLRAGSRRAAARDPTWHRSRKAHRSIR